jgi:hypothetical protein
MERGGQSSIHDASLIVEPNCGNGKEDEEHMYGGIRATLTPTDEKQSLIFAQASPKGEPAKPTQEAVADTHTSQ